MHASLPFRSTAFSHFVTAARYHGRVPRLNYDGGLTPFLATGSYVGTLVGLLPWPSSARPGTRRGTEGSETFTDGRLTKRDPAKYTVHHWPPFC